MQDKEYLILSFMQRAKLRRLFHSLVTYYKERQVKCATNGRFIMCARSLLEHSFLKLMQSVWTDFPKQKLSRDPINGKETLMLNYIGLSKNRRYKQYFWFANTRVRQWIMMKVFKGLK